MIDISHPWSQTSALAVLRTATNARWMLRAEITNLVTIGALTPNGRGGQYGGKIDFTLDGEPCEIILREGFVVSYNAGDHRGENAVTADLTVATASEAEATRWAENLEILGELLSFATNSRIAISSTRWNNQPAERRATSGSINCFNEPFINGHTIADFVNQCFPAYK